MFERILIGVKFTDSTHHVLQTGVELAKIHGSALHVLHVLDYRLKLVDERDAERQRIMAEACQRFEKELSPITRDLDDVKFDCLPGDPALAVCRTARETGADLILLGCHQHPERTPLVRVDYAGSTILEKAPCPVLLVPLIE